MTGIMEWILESLWDWCSLTLKRHLILLIITFSAKIELYGVQHRELSWFRSYLTNRKQFCRVNGVDSKIGDMEVGAAQGSCPGHLHREKFPAPGI